MWNLARKVQGSDVSIWPPGEESIPKKENNGKKEKERREQEDNSWGGGENGRDSHLSENGNFQPDVANPRS